MSERTWPNWNSLPKIISRSSPATPIHVWKDVAQLKPGNVMAGLISIIPIHVWKDVAQLKPVERAAFMSLHSNYPCLKGRGPIETWPAGWVIATTPSSAYPCLKGRGPIETRRLWLPRPATSYDPIHVWKDVAQLKLSQLPQSEIEKAAIHVWKDVAQLKHPGFGWGHPGGPAIHVWKDVAQLKPGQLSIQWSRQFPIHVWKDVAQLKRFKPARKGIKSI